MLAVIYPGNHADGDDGDDFYGDAVEQHTVMTLVDVRRRRLGAASGIPCSSGGVSDCNCAIARMRI